MTLKEELEILRGEPIEVFDGDPMEIPCIETSDAEKICKHPVVSVCMVTYNHEPYIRQAIEGVMMQKTDFEFELVIGEDCSQDKTREICFEYQKKYPDKIRVLWWHENVSKGGLGGNGQRVRARCRGEFIAFCEGDDYWIDPLKLQKQVDVMRRNLSVGLCFCGAKLFYEVDKREENWKCQAFPPGIMTGKLFSLYTIFGQRPEYGRGSEGFVMTGGLMFRKCLMAQMMQTLEIFNWKLSVGDTSFVLGVASLSDVYYLKDQVSVYRITKTGAMGTNGPKVYLDSSIIRLYFSRKVWGYRYLDIPRLFIRQHLTMLMRVNIRNNRRKKSHVFTELLRIDDFRHLLCKIRFLPVVILGRIGLINSFSCKCCSGWWRLFPAHRLKGKLLDDYVAEGVWIC